MGYANTVLTLEVACVNLFVFKVKSTDHRMKVKKPYLLLYSMLVKTFKLSPFCTLNASKNLWRYHLLFINYTITVLTLEELNENFLLCISRGDLSGGIGLILVLPVELKCTRHGPLWLATLARYFFLLT